MNRRQFLSHAGLGALGLNAIASAATEQSESPTDPLQIRTLSAPVITNPSSTGFTVMWAVSGPATGWVEYGETEALGQRADGTDQGLLPFDDFVLKFRVEGLKPGTRYFYRVHTAGVAFKSAYDIKRGDAVTSEISTVSTLRPDNESATFAIWNDTHENRETLDRLYALTRTLQTDFLAWNGDQTNDVYSQPKMIDQFLNPGGHPFAQDRPLVYVRGNHDVRGPAARMLPRFTDVPESRYYYSFRQGPVAVLVLDTGEDKPDTTAVYAGLNDFAAFRRRQREWLAREIEKPHVRTAPYRLLLCHIPLWWKDEKKHGDFSKDSRDQWHDLLEKVGVQLVISGHTHEAAWLPADSQHRYGQLIGGGPKPAAATFIHGEANAKQLVVRMQDLDGKELATCNIAPLS